MNRDDFERIRTIFREEANIYGDIKETNNANFEKLRKLDNSPPNQPSRSKSKEGLRDSRGSFGNLMHNMMNSISDKNIKDKIMAGLEEKKVTES